MIKNWSNFNKSLIREFVTNNSYIDTKMQELKDLIDGVSDGQNIIYEWQNKNDHNLVVSFSTNDISIKYDFDIDDLYIVKTAMDQIDFESNVDTIDEGIEIIKKDIQSILGISENKNTKD